MQTERPIIPRLTPEKRKRNKGDLLLLLIAIFLSAFGVLAVYSASYYAAQVQYGDRFYFMKKQLLGFCIGLPLMLLAGRMNYEVFKGKRVRYVCL